MTPNIDCYRVEVVPKADSPTVIHGSLDPWCRSCMLALRVSVCNPFDFSGAPNLNLDDFEMNAFGLGCDF